MQRLRRIWPTWGIALIGAATLVGAAWPSHAAVVRRPTAVRVGAESSACSVQAPRVLSLRAGARTTLVPDQPQALLLCRYDGPFGAPEAKVRHRFGLVAGRTIDDPVRVRAWAAEFNRLPRMTGTFGCPVDTGAAIVAFFGYASGPPSPVRLDLSGCETASNGYAVRWAGLDGSTILGELEALVHARPVRAGGSRGAIISGYIRLCGGPAPGRCFASTIGSCVQGQGCVNSDRVVAVDAAGDQVAQAKLRPAHSQFTLRVRPGNYAVELLGDGRRVHGMVLQTVGATTHAGRTAEVIFKFDVP